MSDLFGKAQDLAKSDQGEKISDAAIEHGDDAAKKATGGKFDEQIDSGSKTIDGKIGNE